MCMVEKLEMLILSVYHMGDFRKTSVRIYADEWNLIPPYIQRSESIKIFKHRLRCYLIDRKLMV